MPNPWWLPGLWVLNGFLAVVYAVLEAWRLWLLLTAAAPLLLQQRDALRRRWMAGVLAVMLITAVFAPTVVGLMMGAMALGGWLAWRLERFNPQVLYWRITQGLALYALIALGVMLYRSVLARTGQDWLAGGASYLEALAAIALYAYPVGFFAMLAQALFAHPPLPQTPEDLITQVRTRGKGL